MLMATTLRVQSRKSMEALQVCSLDQVGALFARVARRPQGIVAASVVQRALNVLRYTHDSCLSFRADQHRAISIATTGAQTKRAFDDHNNRVLLTSFSDRPITSQTLK